MLENTIVPSNELENQRDNYGNLTLAKDLLHFQQDGAPSHYTVPQWDSGRIYIIRTNRRRGPIEWPSSSTDLTSSDFLSPSFIKLNLCHLKDWSKELLNHDTILSEQDLLTFIKNLTNRLHYCLQNNGNYFEH